MGVLCFEIEKIPDLSLNKYQCLADTGIEGVLKRHENFLRQWHGIGIESSTSFHLLYVFLPSEPMGLRLKSFFIIQGSGKELEMVEPLLKKSPLSDFFAFKRGFIPQICLSAGVTLTKKERIAEIYNPMTGQIKSIHYVPKWEMNEEARLYDLFRLMDTIGQSYTPREACVYRIDLYPVSMTIDVRNKFNPVLKELRGENDIKLMRKTESVKADGYARDICKEYEDWITSIETTPHFRVNMYAFASDVFKAKMLLNAVGAEALNEGDFSIAPIKADEDGTFCMLSRMDKAEEYCFYPAYAALKSWSTTYCLSEIVPFFRFPTLYDGENIEIPKESSPVQEENGVYLGEDSNGYPVYIRLEDIPKHAFFTGMPGSGKTNTMLHFIMQLKRRKIPFLVLEPAKKEYRNLLGHKEMQDIYLFSPHLQSRFPLQMNPMEFPIGVRLSEHINALLEVFEGSFILEGPTYKFLSSAIQRSYTDLGWDIEEENREDCELSYPSLQDVYDNLESEIDASSYDTELKGNVRAFLQVRLGSLMERDAGELFNVHISSLKPEEWIKVCSIVELEVLGEQAKNFFVLLVCHYIVETLRANPNGGVSKSGAIKPVRHAVFIEEAHNIIAPTAQQMGKETVNPKVSATAYIVKMLAEVRALREAIVIADQLPTALASEVTKNTGLKVVHRLTAQDEREQIGTAISASPLQLERIASFTSGMAYIYHEKTMKPFEIKVAEWKVPETGFDISNDIELYSRLLHLPTIEKAITVAFRNWQDKYLFRIENEVSVLQERYKNAKSNVEFQCCNVYRESLVNKYRHCMTKVERYKRLWRLSESKFPQLWAEVQEVEEYINGIIENLG